MNSKTIFMELLNNNLYIPERISASFGKFILDKIERAPFVELMGEFMDSVMIDHNKVPVKAYTGYGIPVSVSRMVPELVRKIQTKAVVIGFAKAHNIPK